MSACASCKDPLVVDVSVGVNGVSDDVVPDDLLLPCGCHFHWQCLLDEATQVASSLQCPACSAGLTAASSSSSSAASAPTACILTRYVNEGGLQDNYDIYPDVAEEAYLLAHPEARPARAFLTMCGAGDVAGIVSLLGRNDEEDEDEDEDEDDEAVTPLSPEDLLRYQDPLHDRQSGLHVAIDNGQEEVLYLLLYLASRLPLADFPPAVLQSAEQMGMPRPASVATHADIRSLTDGRGQTAEAYAQRKGGAWAALAATGIFTKSG